MDEMKMLQYDCVSHLVSLQTARNEKNGQGLGDLLKSGQNKPAYWSFPCLPLSRRKRHAHYTAGQERICVHACVSRAELAGSQQRPIKARTPLPLIQHTRSRICICICTHFLSHWLWQWSRWMTVFPLCTLVYTIVSSFLLIKTLIDTHMADGGFRASTKPLWHTD